jgi:hypothetical protein
MTQDAPSSPTSTARTPEVRISTVVGDRLCIKCGFNLSGQPVVRESVYGMAIVRCPECSTIASLQEYPLLGRWARRIAAALAALWLLLLIGGTFATAGIMFGMSQQCLESGGTRLAAHVARSTRSGTNRQQMQNGRRLRPHTAASLTRPMRTVGSMRRGGVGRIPRPSSPISGAFPRR